MYLQFFFQLIPFSCGDVTDDTFHAGDYHITCPGIQKKRFKYTFFAMVEFVSIISYYII